MAELSQTASLFKRRIQPSKNLNIAVAAALLSSLISVIQAWIIALLISSAFSGAGVLSYEILILFLAVSAVKAALLTLNRHCSSIYAQEIKEKLRKEYVLKIPTVIKKGEAENILTLLLNSIEPFEAYFKEYAPSVFLACISPFVILIPIALLDVWSAVILFVTAPLIPLFMYLIGTKAKSITQKQWRVLNFLSLYFFDTIQGLTTLKTLGKSQERFVKISEMTDKFSSVTLKALKVAFVSSLAIELLSTLSVAIVAVAIGLRLLFGHISYLHALFVLILAPEFYMPLRVLASKFHASLNGKEAKEKLKSFKDSEVCEYLLSGKNNSDKDSDNLLPIELSNVTLRYPNGVSALSRVSFRIEENLPFVIKGKSGSGKTSLLKLILNLIEPTEGIITYGNNPFKREYYSRFSWVPQEPFIFNRSIRENILVGKAEASEKEIERAVNMSCLDEFVSSLKYGLDTIVGERGMRLSGGQIQKIAIARALIKDAPILVIDEGTSSIDTNGEEMLIENLMSIAKSKTLILSAHRSSFLKNFKISLDMDRI